MPDESGNSGKGEPFYLWWMRCGIGGEEEPMNEENHRAALAKARRLGWVQTGPRKHGWVCPFHAEQLRREGKL